MKFPLSTSVATVRSAPLLLIDLETEEGITGRTYLFCYRPSVPRAIDVVLRDAVSVVKGEPVAPLDIGAKLARRFALVGVASVVRMALSGLDVALWDALAIAAGLPLATFLGAKPKPIPAYNSSGLGLMSPEAAADEAEKLLAGGFLSVKLRLGNPNLEQDLAVTRAVRKRLPDVVELPVDYNQALTVAEAIRRGRALEGEGVARLEEPIRHDDYAGNAAVARALALPVQIGENFNGPQAMIEALAARAGDYVMPDAARIGRRERLDPGGRHRCSARHRDVVASAARDQCAPARCDPDLPLPGVCRLGRHDPRRAAADSGWPRTRSGPSGHRTHVEIGSREGPVAGPLICHLASAAPIKPPFQIRTREDRARRPCRSPAAPQGLSGIWIPNRKTPTHHIGLRCSIRGKSGRGRTGGEP